MDSENNITTPSKKTSEEVEKPSHGLVDPNQNPECDGGNLAATTKQCSPASVDALPSSSINSLSKDHEATSKNASSENDTNSEDIQLKWDDDSDIEVSVTELISNDDGKQLEQDIKDIDASGNSEASIDNKMKRYNQTDEAESMDVDTSDIESITDKINDLIKDDDKEETAKISSTDQSSEFNDESSMVILDTAHERDLEDTNITDESTHVDSTEVGQGIIQELGDMSKVASSFLLEETPLVAEPTAVVTAEPNANKKLSSIPTVASCTLSDSMLEADTSEEVPLVFSDGEDDALLPPSKEEEDILLAEPTSTPDSLKLHPEPDTVVVSHEMTGVALDASEKIFEVVTGISSPEYTTSIKLSKEQDMVSKDPPLSSTYSDAMALDNSDDIMETTESSLLNQPESATELSKEKYVIDAVGCEFKDHSDKDQMAAFSEAMTMDTSHDIIETTEKLVKPESTTGEPSKEEYVMDIVAHTLDDETVATDNTKVSTPTKITIDTLNDTLVIDDNVGLIPGSAKNQPDIEVMRQSPLDTQALELKEQIAETQTVTSATKTSNLETTAQEKKSLPLPDSSAKASEFQVPLDASKVILDSADPITQTETELETNTISDIVQTTDSSQVVVASELVLQAQSSTEEMVSGASETVRDIHNTIEVVPDVCYTDKTSASNVAPSMNVSEPMTTNASDNVQMTLDSNQVADTPVVQKSPASSDEISKHPDTVIVLDEPTTQLTTMKTISDGLETAVQTVSNVSEPLQAPANASEAVQKYDTAVPFIPKDSIKTSEVTTSTSNADKGSSKTILDASDTVQTTSNDSITAQTTINVSATVLKFPETATSLKMLPKVSTPEVTTSTSKADEGTSKTILDALETAQTASIESKAVKTISNSSEALQTSSDTVTPFKMLPKVSVKTPEAINNFGLSSEANNIEAAAPIAAEMTADTSKVLQTSPTESDKVPETPGSSASTTNQLTVGPEPSDKGQQMTDSLGLLSESVKPVEDTLDDLQEFTDSLGLLAESSGPRDEEEEPEIEEEDDGDDDEEADDDQDDESNHPTTADQSEDSNAQTSENDAPNPTDIEISQDGFGGVGASGTGVAAMAGAKETAKDVDLDVDNEFDKLLAAVAKEKPPSADEQAKSTATSHDAMELDETTLAVAVPKDKISILREVLCSTKEEQVQDKAPDTPSKGKKLSRCSNVSMKVLNIVELEESSSEDDTTARAKTSPAAPEAKDDGAANDAAKQEDTVAKPAAAKPRIRLNTDELTIKTAVAGKESTLVIPEAKLEDLPQLEQSPVPKFSLEVFNLDSDEEESGGAKQKEKKVPSPEKSAVASPPTRCGNPHCHGADTTAAPALKLAAKRTLCPLCASLLDARLQNLMAGVKELTPLLELESAQIDTELVEISDSDSDDGGEESASKPRVTLGEDGAKLLEGQLADLINDTWRKYELDARLAAATHELDAQMAQFERDRLDIDKMLDECQVATDALRSELYAAFALPQRQLPPIEIVDTLSAQYAKVISEDEKNISGPARRAKRPRMPSKEENQPKRPAIPLGFTGDNFKWEMTDSSQGDTGSRVDDDNTDIKVVALSAESAPAGLPAVGTLVRQPVAVGMPVYGMKHAFGAWQRATIVQVPPKGDQPYSTCKVRFEVRTKNNPSMLSARSLAYAEPPNVRLTIATRVIALSQEHGNKKKSFYSGVIAEMPNPVNSYRYLVFFDGGYAQYVAHCDTRVVCECSPLVWEEVHPFSREFVREYLRAYPERPMVRLHAGQSIKTEWNGKWWVSKVIRVDASLVEVHFEADNRYEWIYRGSTRLAPLYLELQAAERHRARPLPRSTQAKKNMPYVEYTRTDEQESNKTAAQLAEQELKRQRAVAKKSTTTTTQNNQQLPLPALSQDAVMSRVVYYTPKAAVKPHKMTPHVCTSKCRRTDVLPLKELRTYNPLARPLLSGWERQLVRHKGRKEVMYRAPCGRRLRDVRELHRYLRAIGSDMAVDLFDFSATTHCLAEFVLNRCLVSKKDLSHGKENVPVPCVNYYDTSLPEFCSYNTERTPTAGVPLNLDPEFLCGCDCEDDCQDKSKCKCWKLTLDGARTVGQDGSEVGYVYKRLLEPVPSGIYECNSRCKCKLTCLNRVAQHPLQLKLQVFKTPNRGWGIRALNDVPKGAFLCVYAGNLLTDATANLDGLNEGDEYLAELDYIEVVEQMKDGYEDDIPDRDKDLDSKESRDSDSDSVSSSEDTERADGDFRPDAPVARTEFSKRLRRRDKKEKQKKEREDQSKEAGERERGDCITISDDEEVREPSRFMAQPGMGSKDYAPKYRSVRAFFGEDEACYIMDAKVQGNIGRYLNHSCCPNVFVQNVFVDTHDPRFPWVAFFALSHIRAGTELTWNYNYDVGSVPDKVLYCYCGAPNCRGRLL